MPVRSQKGRGGVLRAREPMKPRLSSSLGEATPAGHALADDVVHRRLGFFDFDLSGRSADSVELEQCRFRNADLSGTSLAGATVRDCLVEHSNLANLRAGKSTMLRVGLSVSRLTGLHWIDGSLRDVKVSQCRADLASFRFSDFHNVVFEGCNLTRSDFQDADVGGVQSVTVI